MASAGAALAGVRLNSTARPTSNATPSNAASQWRGLATRYEKTATVYRAGLLIAGVFRWSAR